MLRSYFLDPCPHRPAGAAHVLVCEASMRNGFGLKFVHRFLNVPFLALQRQTLLGLLRTNGQDTQATLEELESCQETEEADYDR